MELAWTHTEEKLRQHRQTVDTMHKATEVEEDQRTPGKEILTKKCG